MVKIPFRDEVRKKFLPAKHLPGENCILYEKVDHDRPEFGLSPPSCLAYHQRGHLVGSNVTHIRLNAAFGTGIPLYTFLAELPLITVFFEKSKHIGTHKTKKQKLLLYRLALSRPLTEKYFFRPGFSARNSGHFSDVSPL